MEHPLPETSPSDRVKGKIYNVKGHIRLWAGSKWHCEHDRQPSQCRDCGTGMCEHNRRKCTCKECGGASICEHKRLRAVCKECGGSSICEHNRQRHVCKECGGTSICEHNRERCTCKECGGSSICEHGYRRSYCEKCGGENKSICEHGRTRSICKECDGNGICEHNRQKHLCRECGGSSICEHDRRRSQCKECGGSSICEHSRMRHQCKECGGVGICEHGIPRHRCKDCHGASICEHGRYRNICRTCFIHPEYWCKLCTYKWISGAPYKPYCFQCYCYLNPDLEIPRRYMAKENYIHDAIKDRYPIAIHNKVIEGGCSHKRPDWLIDLMTHSIVIECDENQHTNYECETKRMLDIFLDLGSRPLVFIRFNPDAYHEDDVKHSSCFDFNNNNALVINEKEWAKRKAILIENIEVAHSVPEIPLKVLYLFSSIK